MPIREAFCDESFVETSDGGFYVLAAAIVDSRDHESLRELLRDLNGRRRRMKLHWGEMDDRSRRVAIECVVRAPVSLVAAVGQPVLPKRQERARAACLQTIAFELFNEGVEVMHLESRTDHLDRRDIQTVAGARFCLPKGTSLVAGHRRGNDEPLLWLADITAGAIRAARLGTTHYRHLLGDLLVETEVATGC